MSVNRIDIGVIERIAPSRGPTSSVDYNATNQEVINALSQIALSWNTEIHLLLDTLPQGNTSVIRENRTEDPNPYQNGFDGSQLYLDLTSTNLTDDGKYYDVDLGRPFTVKESIEGLQDQLNNDVQDLQVRIAQVSLNTGITPRQKQAIGSNIFDAEATSSPDSLDGTVQVNTRNIDQLGLDISGESDYLTSSGSQTLTYAILEQLQSVQDAHDYNSTFNTMTHGNFDFHDHKYHQSVVGDLNGVNKDYYTPGAEVYVAGSLRVIVNGLELQKGIDYTEHPDYKGLSITAGHRALEYDAIGSDDRLWVHYDLEA